MKHHLVVKTRLAIPEPPRIPDWITFITDKSYVVTSVDHEVDRVLHDADQSFWVTHEYVPVTEGYDQGRAPPRAGTHLPAHLAGRRGPAPRRDRAAPGIPAFGGGRSPLEVTGVEIPRESARAMAAGEVTRGRGSLVGLDFAQAVTRGREDVNVAVLDTGANQSHPELAGRISSEADFVDLKGLNTSDFVGDFLGRDNIANDELGHGTHVCGIVAGQGVAMDQGIAPRCRLMPVRVLATLKQGDRLQVAGIVDNINPAIKWAVDQGADVINMSLGIRHTGGGLPHEDVIRYALAVGVTVVAASGNDGTSTKYYPGALPGVVAVGAVDDDGQVTTFTSYGAAITVVAPGVNILSSYAQGRYATASGTSQASPFVAGAIALLVSAARDRGTRLRGRGHSDRPAGDLGQARRPAAHSARRVRTHQHDRCGQAAAHAAQLIQPRGTREMPCPARPIGSPRHRA